MSVSEWFRDSQVSLWYDKVRKRPPIYHERPHLPEITLSALAKTGHAELTIPVLKQQSHSGNEPVISSTLADTPCADLSIDGVLEKLNAILSTSYSLRSKILHPSRKPTLHSILKPYVARNDDFGTVYAHLRCLWYHYDITEMEYALRIGEEEDRNMRRRVLVHDRITRRWVPPRHVWDLYANCVVPYWVADRPSWGISHAWVNEKDHMNAMMPINRYEWPIPMPKDANLDLIRIEMLNLRVVYEGGKGEDLHLEEWKLDVPSIGSVYAHGAHVVCYFNGLGRPLHLPPDYFESDCCWFRCAWTLQEITNDLIIGGETGNDIMEKDVRKMFDEQLARLQKIRERNFSLELVSEMQNR
ncbi:hypothetical protein IW262DRAFT_1295966 [Armillaria fumosa]|nr:hypothetical protein IW262DRAFT_1295966 [Armillaria fumosa]